MALNKDRKSLKEKPSINIEPINIDTAEGFIYPSPEDQIQLGSKLNGDKKTDEEISKNESELSNKVQQTEKEESELIEKIEKKDIPSDSGKIRTSLYIKKEYFEKMQLAAENEGVPASAIVMAALKDFFQLHPELIATKKKSVNWDNI